MESSDQNNIIALCEPEVRKAAQKAMIKLVNYSKISVNFTQEKNLYHYCSLETFYNIIDSNCFWLSHPKFMNDLSEYQYSIVAIKKFIHKYNEKITNNDASKELLKLIESDVKNYKCKFKGIDAARYEKLHFFTCFSSDGDSLPMWSMYKGNNIGISIGLDFCDEDYFVVQDTQKRSPFIKNPKYFFFDIKYEEELFKQATNIFLDHIRDFYNSHHNEFNNYREIANTILSKWASAHLINMSTMLKNSNFSYEKETRFILNTYESSDIKFRVKNKFIVPYIEFPVDDNKQKYDKPIIPIKSITISPNAEEPDLIINSIWAFLNHKGYNIDKKNIRQSSSPFKPR